MSAESAHLSTFGAETETEAEIRSTSIRYCNYLASFLIQRLKIAQYRSIIWGPAMDDRRPNLVTAIARMTGLSGTETISTNLYTF